MFFITGCKSTEKTTTKEEDKLDLRPFSLDEENLIGKAVAAELINKYGLESNKELTDYIAAIGNTLVLAAEKTSTQHGYTFGILTTDKELAYAAPDGYIFLSTGLLNQMENEDQAAAILAVQIAHIVNNDPITNLDMEIIKKANEAFKAVKNNLPDNDKLAAAFSLVVSEIKNNLKKGYTKEIVKRADKESIKILNNAGYSADALLAIVKKLADNSRFFNDSYSKSDREKQLKKEIKKTGVQVKINKKRTRRFKKIVK